MNPGKPHQLRYVYSVGWSGWDVAVHMGEIDDLKVEVTPLVVDADMISCSTVFVSYSSGEIKHFIRCHGGFVQFQFRQVDSTDVISKTFVVYVEYIVCVAKGITKGDGFRHILFHCCKHEIILGSVDDAHRYTNNLLSENRVSEADVDIRAIYTRKNKTQTFRINGTFRLK